MKKLITTAAFLMFGTMFISAQTTKKTDNSRKMPEKPVNSTEMKMDTSVQPNGMNRTVDTATRNNKSKMQENPNRMQQIQTLPSTGTMQNNGTLQNPNTTMPNNSTATPQVQPVSPVDATRTTK